MNGKNCKLRFGGQDIEMMDFGDDWVNYSFPYEEKTTVSFSGCFDPAYDLEPIMEAFRSEPINHKIKLHVDDYMHYEMDGNFKSQEIYPNGSINVMIVGDSVKVVYSTIKKQFIMHPQSRNPICWTIERMFG